MLTNSLRVAVIEYHNSWQGTNPYATTVGVTRMQSFYGATGNPTAKFDGIVSQVGGVGAPNSMYSYYLTKYNQRQGILSDFTIEKTVYPISGNDYMAHITINKVGSPTSTNLRLMTVITESHRAHNWGTGLTEVNHIFRLFVANGTTIDFGTNSSVTFNIPFTLDAAWVMANLEMDIFVQDFTTKEVFQGTVAPLSSIVGVTEVVKNDFNLNIYPNPMNETAMIAFDTKETSTAVINIYNIVGKNVYSNNLGTVNAGVTTVDFDGSKLAAGMYIVNLTVNNQTITKKISINK